MTKIREIEKTDGLYFCEHKWIVRSFRNVWSCTECEEEWELEV